MGRLFVPFIPPRGQRPRSRTISHSTPASTFRKLASSRRVILLAYLCATCVFLLAGVSHPASREFLWRGQAGTSNKAPSSSLSSDDYTDSPSPGSSTAGFLTNQDTTSYRHHLELTTSPPHFTHSPTLTFSRIYVLSLPSRQDRRTRMSKLARALGLEFTFVDALPKSEGVIRWIGERVEEVRKLKAPLLAKHLKKHPSTVGGMKVGSEWLTRSDGRGNLTLPSLPSLKERRWGGLDWVSYLKRHGPKGLDAKEGEGFKAAERLSDPLEENRQRQLSEGSLAVWFGQVQVMQEIVKRGDKSALVLEDDVDFEWDLERLWASVYRRLPDSEPGTGKGGWQMAFLGHCWGRESMKPQYLHPLLHQSSEPRCLHAYALSAYGARRLLSFLSDPWIAYQTAIDIAVPTFITTNLFGYKAAFSVEPQLIVQAKELMSDIQTGTGSNWRGMLMDSTWERILKDEGIEVLEPVFVGGNKADPATRYRGPTLAELQAGLDPEEAHAAVVAKVAAERKAQQDKAREKALARVVEVEGVNAPVKAPLRKLPGPAVGKEGEKAAAAGGVKIAAMKDLPVGRTGKGGNSKGKAMLGKVSGVKRKGNKGWK